MPYTTLLEHIQMSPTKMLMTSKRRERKLPFTMVSLHQMHRLNWILVYRYVEESLKVKRKRIQINCR